LPLGLRESGAIRIGYAIEAPYTYLQADSKVIGDPPEVARRIVARRASRISNGASPSFPS
jgi:polar amino acid transport system substrate-binding protein